MIHHSMLGKNNKKHSITTVHVKNCPRFTLVYVAKNNKKNKQKVVLPLHMLKIQFSMLRKQ